MGSVDYSYEYLDWWHEALGYGEDFEHNGSLNSHIINPALTIGISDYLNLTIAQTIGIRTMDYKGPEDTPHHRDEDTTSPFDNAVGGMSGDTRLMLRYLILNDGNVGNRLFIGSGIVIPSKNRLTESPFVFVESVGPGPDGITKDFPEHRHFSMSEGTYQWTGEIQFFRKLTPPIIFWGASSSIAHPIKESVEGFLSPTRFDLSLTFITQKIKWIDAALGLYMQYKYSGDAKWHGKITPNSKAEVLSPGFGLIWTTQNKLGIAMNFLFPKLITGNLAQIESGPEQELTSIQCSIGIRKTFDYVIPFLE